MTPEESARLAELESKDGPITKEYVDLVNKLAAHNLKKFYDEIQKAKKKK